ncbi:MAG: HAD family hydrolase [Actinomycetota bacterium]|nr:HAD family hydrolase [Actinomycetota bacterium]
MISLVIFDCDGVLVDSEPISCRMMAEALTAEGLPYTTEQCMRDYMGRAWDDSLRLIAGKLGHAPTEGFTEGFRERRDAALRKEVEPVPGVREAIAAIGAKRCVASSGTHEKIRLTLGQTGLLALFDGAIFSATEVARGKPAPDLFLHAARTLGHEPKLCAVVEDTPVGIEAARAAGMTALAYVDNVSRAILEEAGATRTFGDMRDLPALLRSANA